MSLGVPLFTDMKNVIRVRITGLSQVSPLQEWSHGLSPTRVWTYETIKRGLSVKNNPGFIVSRQRSKLFHSHLGVVWTLFRPNGTPVGRD